VFGGSLCWSVALVCWRPTWVRESGWNEMCVWECAVCAAWEPETHRDKTTDSWTHPLNTKDHHKPVQCLWSAVGNCIYLFVCLFEVSYQSLQDFTEFFSDFCGPEWLILLRLFSKFAVIFAAFLIVLQWKYTTDIILLTLLWLFWLREPL